LNIITRFPAAPPGPQQLPGDLGFATTSKLAVVANPKNLNNPGARQGARHDLGFATTSR